MAEENQNVDANEVEQTEQVVSQEQIDTAVAKRLSRQKETFAKKLGIKSYSDENIENFLASIKSKDEKIVEYETASKELQTEIRERDFKLEAMQSGIANDNIDRAIKLAKLEIESDQELDIAKAFELVIDTFPMFKQQEKKSTIKIGDEVSNEVNTKTEVDQFNEKYKNSKYYKGR